MSVSTTSSLRVAFAGALLLALLPLTTSAQTDVCFVSDIDGGGQFDLVLDLPSDVFGGTYTRPGDGVMFMATGARGVNGRTIRHHSFTIMSPDPDGDPGCGDGANRVDWGIWNGRVTGGGGSTYSWEGNFTTSCSPDFGFPTTGTITLGSCPPLRTGEPANNRLPTVETARALTASTTPLATVDAALAGPVAAPEGGSTFCYVDSIGEQFEGTLEAALDIYYGPGDVSGNAFIAHGARGTTGREARHHSFTFQNPTAGADPGCGGTNGIVDWFTQNGIVSGSGPTYSFSGINYNSCGNAFDVTATITLGGCPAPRQVASENGNRVAQPEGAAAVSSSVVSAAGPNPFASRTTIVYALTEAAHVRLAVYDVLGREVAVLVDEQVGAGSHSAAFEAGTLPSGTYVYRLEAGDHVTSRPITLVR